MVLVVQFVCFFKEGKRLKVVLKNHFLKELAIAQDKHIQVVAVVSKNFLSNWKVNLGCA